MDTTTLEYIQMGIIIVLAVAIIVLAIRLRILVNDTDKWMNLHNKATTSFAFQLTAISEYLAKHYNGSSNTDLTKTH